MLQPEVYDPRTCELGEGVLWHPKRKQLFWFDIEGQKLLSLDKHNQPLLWQFDEPASAAGWLDDDHLLVASETSLNRFSLVTGEFDIICALEADNPITRSNDGRADPWGGFWIGTMGRHSEPEVGAIYRYFQGDLRQLFNPLSVPNAISFSPDGLYAYFADTLQNLVWRQPLEQIHGWPKGEPEIFLDFRSQHIYPDGAVVDSQGNFWNAQFGGARVACYNRQGEYVEAISFPTSQITCPAFGGDRLTTLFATSATQHLPPEQLEQQTLAGHTFYAETLTTGQAEYQVKL